MLSTTLRGHASGYLRLTGYAVIASAARLPDYGVTAPGMKVEAMTL